MKEASVGVIVRVAIAPDGGRALTSQMNKKKSNAHSPANVRANQKHRAFTHSN